MHLDVLGIQERHRRILQQLLEQVPHLRSEKMILADKLKILTVLDRIGYKNKQHFISNSGNMRDYLFRSIKGSTRKRNLISTNCSEYALQS
jgi:hypothetical protein